MRVAIIENMGGTHHGQVGVALHEAAALVDIYRPWIDGALPEPGSFDALVSFGGGQSALEDDAFPYLPRLAELMAERAAAGTAVLGICLGSQVFARGLGSANHLGAAREFGWCRVERTGIGDPVLDEIPKLFQIFEWHSDTFSLPPGAAHLASSAVAPLQAFRYGRAGYGMQFHFEASRAVVGRWVEGFPEAVEAMSPGWAERLPGLAELHGVEADAHGLAIARAWVAQI